MWRQVIFIGFEANIIRRQAGIPRRMAALVASSTHLAGRAAPFAPALM
jgi:hypothetical protein